MDAAEAADGAAAAEEDIADGAAAGGDTADGVAGADGVMDHRLFWFFKN